MLGYTKSIHCVLFYRTFCASQSLGEKYETAANPHIEGTFSDPD